jgi:hypothetical protein
MPRLPASLSGLFFSATNTSTSVVTLGSQTPTNGLSAVTLEAWVNLEYYESVNSRIVGNFSSPYGFELFITAGSNILTANMGNSTSGSNPTSNAGAFPLNQQVHIALTWDGVNARLFQAGVLVSTAALSGGNTGTPSKYLTIGNYTGAARPFPGIISEVRISNIARYTASFTPPTAPFTPDANTVGLYHLNEGQGTVAQDSSSNANHGTLSGSPLPTWAAGKWFGQVGSRQQIGANLVYNGNFELAPSSSVAQTSAGTYIDGTAGGSSTNQLYGWLVNPLNGTASTQFDAANPHTGNYALKLSTLATNSKVGVNSLSIPVLPATSYTLTGWIKATNHSGSSSTGIEVNAQEYNVNTFIRGNTLVSGIVSTQGWTLYSLTFTTSPTTNNVQIAPQIFGTDGAATLILDAWIDDFTLQQVAPPRSTVQNFPCSLNFNGSSTKVSGSGINLANSDFTVSVWAKVANITGGGGNVQFFSLGNGESSDLTLQLGISSQTVFFGFWSDDYEINPAAVDGGWHHYVFTFQASTKTRTVYRDGVLLGTNTSGGVFSGNTNFTIGSLITNTSWFNGRLVDLRVYNQMASAALAKQMYSGNYTLSGLVAHFNLTEGSGSTAYDTSGNGNNGTITSGTYTSDVPSKTRGLVGGNLVYNGSFEFAPPTNVAQTGSNKWIDGTSGGSSSNALFGWSLSSTTGTISTQFDSSNSHSGNFSVKTSTLATGSLVETWCVPNSPSNIITYGIPCTNQSYTLSAWMKTVANSGSASSAAHIFVNEYTGSGSYLSTATLVSGVTATTGWTQYAGTFTPVTGARYLVVGVGIKGNDGTGTLIMDAWYDNIELYPTVNTSRTTAQ